MENPSPLGRYILRYLGSLADFVELPERFCRVTRSSLVAGYAYARMYFIVSALVNQFIIRNRNIPLPYVPRANERGRGPYARTTSPRRMKHPSTTIITVSVVTRRRQFKCVRTEITDNRLELQITITDSY